MTKELEVKQLGRIIKADEVKDGVDDGRMRFEGYLACFNNVDSYGDVILKGAFEKTIKSFEESGRFCPVLEQHGGFGMGASDYTPIGFFESLAEDDTGLYVKGVLFSTQRGTDMYKLLKELPKGCMGMSIGYRTINQRAATMDEHSKTGVRRWLTELELMEGSIVTFPANPEARVEDVKADALYWREVEKALKAEGFSNSFALKAVSIMKSMSKSDEPDYIATEAKDTVEVKDSGVVDESINELKEALVGFNDSLTAEAFRRGIKEAFASVK